MTTGILAVLLVFGSAGAAELVDLAPLQWEHRIILVRTAEPSQELAELKKADAAIRERHIVWFVLTPTEVLTNYSGKLAPSFSDRMSQTYFLKSEHRAVLIGKDGGIKDECSRLDLPFLFYLIDRMPMRQQEMRQSKKGY